MLSLGKPVSEVCRPALPKDTEQVMELCSHIWEGDDYIPHVWNRWMADSEGLLGVAELAGRVVGVFKLTKFQEGEWYMEGLRVHPDFQGRGIASHIHDYMVDTWRRMGSGVVRLLTASYNVKVHHMCEQTGFKRVAEFIPYRAPSMSEKTDSFTTLKAEEAQSVLEFADNCPTHVLSNRLINLGWMFGDPQLDHIQEVIGSNHAWWWRGDKGFISIWEHDEDDEREPVIQLIACSLENLPVLLVDYRRLMGKLEYKSAGWVAPNHSEVITDLEEAGFERRWDMSIYVFELKSSEG